MHATDKESYAVLFDQQIFTMLEKQAVAKANSSPWINFQKNNN